MAIRALFVDDEPMVVQALARMLRNDYDVDTATSGAQACEMLSQNAYAIVVSDMKMPGISGAHLLKHVYQNSPGTARMLLTAQCDVDEQTFAISEGHIHGMLYKPCSAAELRNALKVALHRASTLCVGM